MMPPSALSRISPIRPAWLTVLFLGLLLMWPSVRLTAADRPNFVWIVSEDNSTHYLRLFDRHGAETPHIAELARHGLVFDNAFSNAPVCSVARTTLATSVYVVRIGSQFHRKLRPVKLPPGWKLFQEYLKDAGYFTTNRVKTDYNLDVNVRQVWNECSRKASWRHRRPGQPFFHMESHPVSHESSLHFDRHEYETKPTRTDPSSVTVWPYFPDTKLFRYTTARYHDRMRRVDEIVGKRVAELKADGLLDDTFIFYFGDHGGVLPDSKGYLWERGLHVPLVVYIPKNWRHLLDAAMKPGTRVRGFVEFVDFGPTLLHLAGVDVPPHMDGRPFLGDGVTLQEVDRRDETFSYADRMDERYEMVRAVRKGRFKYLRFFQGYYPDALQNNYRYRMLAYQQWREFYRTGKLDETQSAFFRPKPVEALYDVIRDPHELHNLADDPQYQSQLADLRQRLRRRMETLPDLSLFPESVLIEQAVERPLDFARRYAPEIGRLLDVTELAWRPWPEARNGLADGLRSQDPWTRYWAATVCASLGDQAKPLAETARPLLHDKVLPVRIRAAEFLARVGAADPVPILKSVLRESDNPATTLMALQAVVYARDTLGIEASIRRSDVRTIDKQIERRLKYLATPRGR